MFSTGFNTIATKPVSGPLLREKDNHIRTRSHRGNAPYDFDTGIICSVCKDRVHAAPA